LARGRIRVGSVFEARATILEPPQTIYIPLQPCWLDQTGTRPIAVPRMTLQAAEQGSIPETAVARDDPTIISSRRSVDFPRRQPRAVHDRHLGFALTASAIIRLTSPDTANLSPVA